MSRRMMPETASVRAEAPPRTIMIHGETYQLRPGDNEGIPADVARWIVLNIHGTSIVPEPGPPKIETKDAPQDPPPDVTPDDSPADTTAND